MADNEIVPCAKCRKRPRLYDITGLWYIQCSGHCDRLEVATTRKKVIENWNEINTKGSAYAKAASLAHQRRASEDRKAKVFQLDSNGKPIYAFESVSKFAEVVGMDKHEAAHRFLTAKTRKIRVRGITYMKEDLDV